jgi:Tfp pilus assembly protein PilO
MNIDTQSLKNTLANFVVPIAALVGALVLILAVILPQVQNWPKVQEDLTKTRTLEASLDTKKGILDKMVDFQSVVDEDVKLFSQALSSEPMVPELLTQVDIIAKESGLEVTRLSYSVTDVGGGGAEDDITYKAIIVNMGVLGNYDQIGTFVANMENAARMIEVLNYRFSGENLQNESQYAATFVLRVPYLKVESQASTDSPISLDISGPDFTNILNKVKALKFYDIKVNDKFFNVEEADKSLVESLEEADETSLEDISL